VTKRFISAEYLIEKVTAADLYVDDLKRCC